MAASSLPSSKSSTRQSSLRRAATAAASAPNHPTDGGRKRGHSANTTTSSTTATTTTRGRRHSPEPPSEQKQQHRANPRKRAHPDDDDPADEDHKRRDGEGEDNGDVDSDDALLQENASNKRAKKTVQYAIRPKANGRAVVDAHHLHGRRGGSHAGGLRRTSAGATDSRTNNHLTVSVMPRARGGRVAKAAQPPPSASVAEEAAGTGTKGGTKESGTQTEQERGEKKADKAGKKEKRVELKLENKSTPANQSVSGVSPGPLASGNTGTDRPVSSGAGIAPTGTSAGGEKRTLRSQDGGSRTKSELSLYFPNYDEFISNEPKEEELLKAETRLFITKEPTPKSPASAQKLVQVPPQKVTPRKRRASQSLAAATSPTLMRTPATAAASSSSAAAALTAYKILDFAGPLAKLAKLEKSAQAEDGLTPELYAAAHRRSERQEKQLRNIEKERAQHEKVQLERLYDGLRGPDWLRVMGISGVTESERKGWEGKRSYFVKEVGALLEKFRLWREEERRRKVEKELHDREAEESGDGDGGDEGDEEAAAAAEEMEAIEEEDQGGEEDGESEARNQTDQKPAKGARHKRSPASSDVDAMAAEQLHAEALLSSTSTKAPPLPSPLAPSTPKQGRRRKELGFVLPAVEPAQPEKPMTSFFSKAHQRDAAMKNSKRGARMQYAFGKPVPELAEAPFCLPDEFLTADAKRASARSRRRARRKGREE